MDIREQRQKRSNATHGHRAALVGLMVLVACAGDPLETNTGTGGGQAPIIITPPQSQTVSAGEQVTFSVSATGATPLSYQWLRGGATIAGATQATYSFTASPGDNGAQFSVEVSNAFGSVASNSAILTIQ